MSADRIDRKPGLIESLIADGQIRFIDPGYGSGQDQLSMPVATARVTLEDGERGWLVSNAWYPRKRLQIFDNLGRFRGIFADSEFNQASAMAVDEEGYVYVADDARGMIVKMSEGLSQRCWMSVPSDGILHTRRIGSMAVDDNYLVAYDTALSKVHVVDRFTGELQTSVGSHKVITLEDVRKEDLSVGEELTFNGHHDLTFAENCLVAVHGGFDLSGVAVVPASLKYFSLDGELIKEIKISAKLGEIRGAATDAALGEMFLGTSDKIQVIGESGFLGSIEVPGLIKEMGEIKNLSCDQFSGDLVICHGGLLGGNKYATTGGEQTIFTDREQFAESYYSRITILSRKARALMVRKSLKGPGGGLGLLSANLST